MAQKTSKTAIKETDLYAPVKRMLEGQGYEVKSEVGAADVVACREGSEPLIVELKTTFSLSLFHQAIERQKLTDVVYIAVPRGTGKAFRKSLKHNIALCRRLGLGLMTVGTAGGRMKRGRVDVHLDPGPYVPRKSRLKSGRLLKEFVKRVGDPNTGGATRRGLMTAYRQDALRCVAVLIAAGATKASEVAEASGVEKARRLMADDHYGWFERVAAGGYYGLTPKGRQAASDFANELEELFQATPK